MRGTVYPYDENSEISVNNPGRHSCYCRKRCFWKTLIAILLTTAMCFAIFIPLILALHFCKDQQVSMMNTTLNVTENGNTSSTINLIELSNSTESNTLLASNSTWNR